MSAMAFRYRAVDERGRAETGRLSASSRAEAFRSLKERGLTPLALVESSMARAPLRRRVGTREIAQFTHEFGVLLQAGVPIGEGLRAIAEQETNPRMRAVVSRIGERIESGGSVTEALREHERVFGPVYVETIAAAEHSGALVRALEDLSSMLEWRAETNRRLKQALTYPCAVLIALVVGAAFLLGVVVPKFAGMFESRGMDLPVLTRVLIGVGASFRAAWWAYAAGLAACAGGATRAWGTAAGRRAIDRWLHVAPALRQILVSVAVARFARVLGVSLTSGIGLVDALDQAGAASGRPLLKDEARRFADRVVLGQGLTSALNESRYLPTFAKRMLSAGERTATLPKMCTVVARHYEREADHLTKNIGTLVEPVLIALLTGMVLIVALGIFLPMWDMARLMQ